MEFHKIHGTGNDFIVVNNWHGEYDDEENEIIIYSKNIRISW